MITKKTLLTLGLRSLVTLGAMLVVLVLFEFYLRERDTQIVRQNLAKGEIEVNPEELVVYSAGGRRLAPSAHVVIRNHFLSKRDIKIDTNSLGFRGPELAAAKAAHELRMLVLGDSITIEDYLPIEETFVQLTENALNHDNPGRKITLVNSGVGNIGLQEEVSILRDKGLAVQPDVVLVDFYLNDSRPPWGFAGEIGDRGWLRRHSMIAEAVYRHFKMQQWIKDQGEFRFGWIEEQYKLDWKHNHDQFMTLAHDARYDWGSAWDSDSWSGIGQLLEELRQLSEQHKFKVVIAVFPVSFQVYADVNDDAPQQRVKQLAQQFGFEFLDLLPPLRQQGEELFFDQCHPTTAGSKIIASLLAKFLQQQVLPSVVH